MPLIKRGIDPVNLSRAHVAPGIQNELECVTNNTLANVIRQLSSLSKHAEDMFAELTRDANLFFHRANQVQERVDRLKVKVTQLDSTGEEVSLQDIHMRKPFKSSTKKDQQIITLATRPESISEIYSICDAPPPLDKLNPYREDGKDSRKFYTDPTYFFELWCREMTNNTELTKKELHKRRNKNKRPKGRQPQVIREAKNHIQDMQIYKDGMEFVPNSQYQGQGHPGQHQQQHQGQQMPPGANSGQYGDRSPSRPSSLEIQNHNQHMASMNAQGGQQQVYDPHYPQQGQGPPPYSQTHIEGQGMANGNMNQAWDGQNYPGGQVPQYQAPPPYNHNHNVNELNQDYEGYEQTQYNNNTKQYNTDEMERHLSPQQTPTKRTPASRAQSIVTSPRPSAPPPAPPGLMGKVDSPIGASRESLPPPPPPPPLDGTPLPSHMSPAGVRGTPPFGSPKHMQNVRDSPGRPLASPQLSGKSTTPDTTPDMPPPPPPPPLMHTPDTPSSMTSMPPPPPTPPPMEQQGLSIMKNQSNVPVGPPPPAPPPLPPGGMMNVQAKLPNGDVSHSPKSANNPSLMVNQQVDAVSIASNASSNTVSSGSTMKSDENGVPVRDTRCDLLAAIREGIKLRKNDERRHKEQQKKLPTSGIDVQSIMEAAFEIRRKALEANDDSEGEEDEGDGDWSDE